MNENPYLATLVDHEQKPPTRKSFSWVAFMIVLLGGQFVYTWLVLDKIIERPAFVASSMTLRTFVIAIIAMAIGKLATRL